MKLVSILEPRFLRYYSVITGLILVLAFASALLALLGVVYSQVAASLLFDAGIVLLMVQIALVITRTNRKNSLGWIVGRLAYVTLLVTSLGLLLILGGMLINSFQLVGSFSSAVMSAFSATATTAVTCFGICLCAISYHATRESEAWCGLSQ